MRSSSTRACANMGRAVLRLSDNRNIILDQGTPVRKPGSCLARTFLGQFIIVEMVIARETI